MKKKTKEKPESLPLGIIGVGYVGLISAASFSEIGHRVYCYDIDTSKIQGLKEGKMPFFEPGMEKLVNTNAKSRRLQFYMNVRPVVEKSRVLFICVGTPSHKNGSVDLAYVKSAVEDIAKEMKEHKIIVIKSTVPAGTSEWVSRLIKRHYKGPFDVVSNPEFLQEGRAIDSFLKGDRVVLGFGEKARPEIKRIMRTIYHPLTTKKYNAQTIFETNNRTAEMAKYACNAFLSTEISFINNIANLCDEVGADVTTIADVMRSDHRIGPKAFLNAGIGYGGICFPKDMRGLIRAYEKNDYDPTFFKMVERINTEQRYMVVRKLKNLLGSLKDKRIVILGLSFKPGTDDIRDAPSLTVIERLLKTGAEVRACDPVAIPYVQKIFDERIQYYSSINEALKGADGMVLVTEWEKYRNISFDKAKKLMRRHVFIDGRNVYDPEKVTKKGFKYSGIGRGI